MVLFVHSTSFKLSCQPSSSPGRATQALGGPSSPFGSPHCVAYWHVVNDSTRTESYPALLLCTSRSPPGRSRSLEYTPVRTPLARVLNRARQFDSFHPLQCFETAHLYPSRLSRLFKRPIYCLTCPGSCRVQRPKLTKSPRQFKFYKYLVGSTRTVDRPTLMSAA